jgi:hypothetical protein
VEEERQQTSINGTRAWSFFSADSPFAASQKNGAINPSGWLLKGLLTLSTHSGHPAFSRAVGQPNPAFLNLNSLKQSLATSPNRPVADIRSLHKAAIRMSDVLRNLPEGQFTQLCQNGRLACWQLPTSMQPWIQPVHGAGQSNASRPARSILDVD